MAPLAWVCEILTLKWHDHWLAGIQHRMVKNSPAATFSQI